MNYSVSPLNDVQYMKDVQFLKDVQFMNDVEALQDVTPLHTTATTYLSNNIRKRKPAERADSLLDVILGKQQRDTLLEQYPIISWTKDIPILSTVASVPTLMYANYMQPIVDAMNGKKPFSKVGLEIGLNALNEVGEDLDVFANIVKSQVPSAGGHLGLDTLGDSLGVNGKRVKYNYNTGNTLADIGLEIISDPVTWITLGMGAVEVAGSKGLESAAKAATTSITKTLSKEAAEALPKAITKAVIEEGSEATISTVLKNIADKEIRREIFKAGINAKTVIKEAIKELTIKDAYKTFNIVSTAHKIKAGAKALDEKIADIAWDMTPAVIPKTIKNIVGEDAIKSAVQHLYAKIHLGKDNFDLYQIFLNSDTGYKQLVKDVYVRNEAIFDTAFKNNSLLLKKLGLSSTTLQDFIKAFFNKKVAYENLEKFTFKNKNSLNAFLNYINTTKLSDSAKDLFATLVNPISEEHEAFVNLLEVASVGPKVIALTEHEVLDTAKKASLSSMQNFIKSNKKDLEKIYDYVDKEVLTFNNYNYGIKNIIEYLVAVKSDPYTSKKYLTGVANLLDSLGINVDNAPYIDKILKSNMTDKGTALKKLLEATNKGVKLLDSKDYSKAINKVTKQVAKDNGKIINKIFTEAIPNKGKAKYTDILERTLRNVNKSVTKLKYRTDIETLERIETYLSNIIRLQDLPDMDKLWYQLNTLDDLSTSIFENAKQNLQLDKLSDEQLKHIYDLDGIRNFFADTKEMLTKIDTDYSTAFEIAEWYTNLKTVKKQLNLMMKDLNSVEKKYAPDVVQFRKSIKKILDTIKYLDSEVIKDPLVNYISDIDGLVQAQLSHLGMFNVLTQFTHLSENPNTRHFLEQMVDLDSEYRKTIIPNIINAFEEAGLYTQAEQINRVVAQIDTTRNLNLLLNSELPLSMDLNLSKQTKDDLIAIIFDTIDNHGSYTIADILAEDKMDISELTPLKYSESTFSGLPYDKKMRLRDRLYEAMDDHVNSSRKILDNIKRDVGLDNYVRAMDDIRIAMHDLLDMYIYEQSKINYLDNVTLSTLYSIDTTTTLSLTSQLRYALAAYGEKMSVELYSNYNILSRDLNNFYESINLGAAAIRDIDEKLEYPMQAYEVNNLLRTINERYNLYTGSIESGMYAVKRLVPNVGKDFSIADLFEINPSMFNGTNEEFLLLVNRLTMYHDVLHDAYKYTDENYINNLREVLIEVYSRPNTLFAPKNPAKYFNSIGVQQLLTWEVVTKGNLSINNKTAFYTLQTSLQHQKNIRKLTVSDYLGKLESITRDPVTTSPEEIAYLGSVARDSNAVEYANRVIDAHLLQTWHDLSDLNETVDDVAAFIKGDIGDLDYITREINAIEDAAALHRDFSKYGNPEDMMKMYNASFGYEIGLYEDQVEMYAERKANLALNIINMDADQLAGYLEKYTDGVMVFYNKNIVKTVGKDGVLTWSGVENAFNFTEEELKQAGLKIQQDGDWFYIRLTKHPEYIKSYDWIDYTLDTPHINMQLRFNDLINKYKYRLNLYNEDIPTGLLTVETLNKDTWTKFIEEHLDFFGDIEEQKLYQKLTPQGNSSFFNKSFERLNLTVVGGYDAFNLWNQAYSDTFIQHSTRMSRNTYTGLVSMVMRTNKINKYLSLFFNSDFRLNSPLLKRMFKNASDEKINAFFKENNYVVAILKADKDKLPFVFEMPIHNRSSLDKAIAAGGILVPRDTYRAMKQIVNNRMMSDSLAEIYRRVVPSTYKSMYLFTAGFLFRNALDTLLYKNMNELGGLESLPQVLKYEYNAYKGLKLHDQIQKEVLEATGGETFNKETLLQVLAKHTQDEQDAYFLIDLFMESSASGSLSASLSDFLEEYNKLGVDDIRPMWEKFYEDKILFGKQEYNPLYRMRDFNDTIEQTGRLSLFLASVDSGMPINKAIKRVVKTHFDYSGGPDMMDICEKIFWFSTFPLNNFSYYINGGLTKSPTLLKLLMDTQTASWNNGEYTYEELKKTNFLSYHALAGNIRIGNIIIKTSPSVFDFISLVTDPVGNVKERLNPFLSVIVNPKETEPLDLNPLQTQIRNWKKFKEGNPMPSIISKIETRQWTQPLRRYYRRKNYSSSWTSYPKIKKPRYEKQYVYKNRVHRVDTSVRKNHRTYVHKDAVFYQKIPKYGYKRASVLYRQWRY